MKISTGILSLLLPVTAIAQNYEGMNERDMQNMMQQMEKMQTCMQGIDQSRLEAFEQRASTLEAEVKSLCASGKRDDAQQQAMDFGQEVASNPDIQKMMKWHDAKDAVYGPGQGAWHLSQACLRSMRQFRKQST